MCSKVREYWKKFQAEEKFDTAGKNEPNFQNCQEKFRIVGKIKISLKKKIEKKYLSSKKNSRWREKSSDSWKMAEKN